MTDNEKVFEMVKAIAPVFVSEGIALQERIIQSGGNPEKCTINGVSILDAEAQSAKAWAEAFVRALNNKS